MNRPTRRKIRHPSEIVWPAELSLTGLFAGPDRPLGMISCHADLTRIVLAEHKKTTVVGCHVSGTDDDHNDVFLPEITEYLITYAINCAEAEW
jgi:hypothetical protein